MSHSCGRYRLGDLFARCEPQVFELAKKFRRMVERCGPVTMIPQKTRLVFMVRMRFAGYSVRKSALRVALILERRLPPDPRLEQIEPYYAGAVGHYFRIETPDQLDATMQAWIREAYDRGTQKNFVRRGGAARRPSSIESSRSSKNRVRPRGSR